MALATRRHTPHDPTFTLDPEPLADAGAQRLRFGGRSGGRGGWTIRFVREHRGLNRPCELRVGAGGQVAIYHFSAQVISRASGRSAVAAAAYHSSALPDEREARTHDFSGKAVVHSQILVPDGAPAMPEQGSGSSPPIGLLRGLWERTRSATDHRTPISRPTLPIFIIACATATGTAMQASPSEPVSITVTTSVDGASVRQGSIIAIRWRSRGAPPTATVALAPEKTVTGRILKPFATSLPLEGSYRWKIPVFVSQPVACAVDATGACVSDMNPNTTYRIVAALSVPAALPSPPREIASAESETFTMLGHAGSDPLIEPLRP